MRWKTIESEAIGLKQNPMKKKQEKNHFTAFFWNLNKHYKIRIVTMNPILIPHCMCNMNKDWWLLITLCQTWKSGAIGNGFKNVGAATFINALKMRCYNITIIMVAVVVYWVLLRFRIYFINVGFFLWLRSQNGKLLNSYEFLSWFCNHKSAIQKVKSELAWLFFKPNKFYWSSSPHLLFLRYFAMRA